jgi:hypothetical protein
MTKHVRLPTLACTAMVVLTAFTGCGGDTEAKKEPMPVEETVYGDQFKQMNRAREETSKHSNERMDNLNKQLEGQSQ